MREDVWNLSSEVLQHSEGEEETLRETEMKYQVSQEEKLVSVVWKSTECVSRRKWSMSQILLIGRTKNWLKIISNSQKEIIRNIIFHLQYIGEKNLRLVFPQNHSTTKLVISENAFSKKKLLEVDFTLLRTRILGGKERV